jgi:putative membrane protein
MKTFTKSVHTIILSQAVIGLLVITGGNLRAQQAEKPPSQGSGASKMAGGTDAASFIKEASQGNNAEIAMATTAETKAQNADVKKFAEHIRKDHTDANQKLQPIAQAHGVTISATADPKHQKKMDRMQQMTGDQFDKEFMKDMLRDHQQTITKFETATKEIPEADVKQYAQTTLPALREHLQQAKEVAKTVGLTEAEISDATKPSAGMGGAGDASESSSGAKSGATKEPKQ